MLKFELASLPWNIVFGAGSLKRLPVKLAQFSYKRPLILSTPGQRNNAEKIIGTLKDISVEVFDKAVMHVPMETIKEAQQLAESFSADCTISIGGGSTTGLGKALALKNDLPNIAIPTTYAGSEMTNIWGITENGRKVTGRDIKVLPDLILYDPELTMSLPANIAGPSGINAMAQAVVNLTAENENPIISLWAEEAVRALTKWLPEVIEHPEDIEARSGVLYGACLAGAALGVGTTGIHHRLCHTLGGSFNMPHAETHTIILPHTVAFNSSYVNEQTKRLARAMGQKDPAAAIFDLATKVGASTSLKDIGFKERDLEEAANIAVEKPCSNPRPINYDEVIGLLKDAYDGKRPHC